MKAEKALKIFPTQLPHFAAINFLRGKDMTKIKNLTIRFLLFLVLLIAYSLPLNATIHYVQHGQGNNPPYLSWSDAADSIQSAINVCMPGDTVLVANGVYPENLVINNIPIYLLGSSMDSAVIDGRNKGDITISVNADCSIENFEIYGKGKGMGDAAIFSYSNALQIKNIKISECYIGVGYVNGLFNADNIYMKNLIRGFDIGGTNSYYYDISSCVIILSDDNSAGISITSPNVTATITNNIILFTNPADFTAQTGIYLGLSKNVYINNNLISGFTDNINVNGVVDTVFIRNNALIYQYSGSSNPASILSGGDYVFVNNVVLSKNKKGINGDGLVRSNYNLYWENITDLVGVTYGDSDRVADPMSVKDTLPTANSNYDFHLQKYSPGIDKGDPNILDVDSSRSDIGLYGGPFGETYTYQNLAPTAPVNLSGIVSKANNKITLNWNGNSEADTAYYNVYRDTTENFLISPEKIVASPTDTFFTEPIPPGAESLYYKITAVDLDENESLPSEEIFIDIITGVKDKRVTINDYRLYQNYPNPFNPTTKIGYRLMEHGYVKLMAYDIKGELVQVLVNEVKEAGYYEAEFNSGVGSRQLTEGNGLASGIYLYRIEVIGEGNIPRFIDMKKMILIK